MKLHDEMRIKDLPVCAELRCAKCNKIVQSGKAHICGYEPPISVSGGIDSFLNLENGNGKTNRTKSIN